MEKTIKSFKNTHILVIGDTILDFTVKAEAIGVSLETPTLKAAEISREYSMGGAYNVAKNIVALGAKCTFVTLIGTDEYQEVLNDGASPRLTLVGLYEKEYTNISFK